MWTTPGFWLLIGVAWLTLSYLRWRQLHRLTRKVDRIMALVDDLKAAQKEILDALAAIGVSVGNIGTDVDQLLALVSTPSPDLAEVVATATQIKERAVATRDALAAIDAKFPQA